MSAADALPAVTVTGEGAVQLVAGTYPTDRPLPIAGDMLQTRTGPVRVAGQGMTPDGPYIIQAWHRAGSGSYPRIVEHGPVKVMEYDPDGLGPLSGGPGLTGDRGSDAYRL